MVVMTQLAIDFSAPVRSRGPSAKGRALAGPFSIEGKAGRDLPPEVYTRDEVQRSGAGPVALRRYEPRRVRRFSMMTGALCRDDGTTRRRRAAGCERGEGCSPDASTSSIAASSSTPDSRSRTSPLPTWTTSTSMAPMNVRCPALRVRVSMVGLYHEELGRGARPG